MRPSPRILPFERLLFASETLAVGTHRLPATHPDFESYGPASSFFVVFPRNSTAIQHAGGERFIASPAVAPLYNRGQEYRRRRVSAEGDFCDWFAVDAGILRDVVGTFDRQRSESDRVFRFSHARVPPVLYLRQRAVVDALLLHGDADALGVEEEMLDVVHRILAGAYLARRGAAACAAERELAQAANDVLSRTFAASWPLARIAREVGCSQYHLARAFKRATGATLHQHRLSLRLHAALGMLKDGRDDVSSVALALGFSDHSHFTAVFRRRFGVTPSMYRKRARFS